MAKNYRALIICPAEKADEIAKIFKRSCPGLLVDGILDNVDEGIITAKINKPEVVFADITMPEFGAGKLRTLMYDYPGKVVCIGTNSMEAMDSFRNGAFDFLEWPLNNFELLKSIERISEKLGEVEMQNSLMGLNKPGTYKDRILINRHDKAVLIRVEDIIFIQAFGAYSTIVYTNNRSIDASRPIPFYHAQIDPDLFYRAHRSFLINVSHVIEILKKENCGLVHMSEGYKIEMSKAHTYKLLAILAEEKKHAS